MNVFVESAIAQLSDSQITVETVQWLLGFKVD